MIDAVLLQAAVEQEAPPSIRQAVVEQTMQAIERRIRSCDNPVRRRKFERRKRQRRVEKATVILKISAALVSAPCQRSDVQRPSVEVELDGELLDRRKSPAHEPAFICAVREGGQVSR